MKMLFFFILPIFIFTLQIEAQSKDGLTGKPDTSFNLAGAFAGVKKSNPEASLVTGIDNKYLLVESNITYCTTNEKKLLVDVFSPEQKVAQKRTALLIIHGGGWRSGNKSMHHDLAKKLASLGYVCFTPSYRLSTEALYPAAVYDIKTAIRFIRSQATQYNLDTNKIVAIGHSAGGELAAFAGVTNGNLSFEKNNCHLNYSSKVNAIIDIDGILAFIHSESGEGDDSKKISAATHWFGYSKSENPLLWKQASPLMHAGPHTPPVLFINSAVDRMHAGRDDFIKVLDQYKIRSQVKTFEGAPHSFPFFNPWFQPMVETIDSFLKTVFEANPAGKIIWVAKDGSGDFTKLQEAFDAIPKDNKIPVTIFIRNGVYKEKLVLDSSKQFVTLIGEDKFHTILTYDDHAKKIAPNGDTINTFTSYSFKQAGDNFKAMDLTFENTAGNNAGQAVAMHIMGDKVQFINCRFLGHQDVLFAGTPGSRQYFRDCYIEGTTDFIFGPSIAWFQQCHINSKRNSHITAASTPSHQPYGYVFNDCVLTTDSIHVNKVSLGRPWRPYSNVVYLNCYMGSHITPQGWDNWRNAENEKTARYSEYGSYGPGAKTDLRFAWTRQLSAEEANKISLRKVLGNWDPENEN